MGILTWDNMQENISNPEIPIYNRNLVESYIIGSKRAMENVNIGFFRENFPKKEYWRLYPKLKERTLFLDVETNGLAKELNEITVIGTLYKGKFKSFINGINLQDVIPLIEDCFMIVTYNGSLFDIPCIERTLDIEKKNYISLDLRWIFKRLGYSGGLKSIEKQVGINRPDYLKDVNGYTAVLLWRKYQTRSLNALNVLRRYCLEDVKNLVFLLHFAYNRLCKEIKFPQKIKPLTEKFKWEIKISCDFSIIEEIRMEMGN
ncbi:MAG: ribonuclease H-like domain-containing protein [Candidatus Helarchaeota archaeon]|nr:ribonuclease H-like domain-containing protein [Candidatus Helarchaeota archaeon]